MAIQIKDAGNNTINVKTTFNVADNEFTPHHLVDGTSAVSGEISITGGSVAIVSGSIGVSGTSAVSGEFPSGVQYSVGTAAAGNQIGSVPLYERPDGSLSGLKQSTSGALFVTQKHFEPNIVFNNVSTVSSNTDTQVLAAPSDTSKRHFITSLSASNASSTGVTCTFKSNSQNIFAAFVAESGGGVAMSFPTPLICSTGRSIEVALGVATSSVLVTMQGYTE